MSQETDAPTLVERLAALRAECERRLAVCEAQPAGPWCSAHGMPTWIQTVGARYGVTGDYAMHVADVRGWGYLTGTGAAHLTEPEAEGIQDAIATAVIAQRTERPQELRTIIGMLDFAAVLHRDRESCARDAAEQTVEIVEQVLGAREG